MAGSTCEAEYIAASEAAHEGVWMKESISDLGVIPSASAPMTIFCDNTRAIALAKESRFHKRTKHIKRRFNSIHEKVKDGDIEIWKVHTDLNVADPLTSLFHEQNMINTKTPWVLESLLCNLDY